MKQLKDWFNEAGVINVFTFKEYDFVIVSGFKITHYKKDDTYSIQDARTSDFYTEVKEEDMKVLQELGFVKGAYTIAYNRNLKRVDDYTKAIEILFAKRVEYNRKLPKNKPFYTKRIKNCNKNIHDNHDMLQFYRAKVEQYENKNNLI